MKRAKPSKATIRVHRLAHAQELSLPSYQTTGSAGMDLLAANDQSQAITVEPGDRILVPTGLVMELPAGYEAQVRPRSGLALKHGMTVLNSPGTIDSDYRGELQVLLINLGRERYTIRRGDRIAQLVIAPVTSAMLLEITEVSLTVRGTGGFGSTDNSRKVLQENLVAKSRNRKNIPPRKASKKKGRSLSRRAKTQSA